jgi:hypothetical protein
MTNDVPTKLVAVIVTTQNYYYKPPVHKSKSKNILVEKKCNKETDAQLVKKVLNKIVKRKNKNWQAQAPCVGHIYTFSINKAN